MSAEVPMISFAGYKHTGKTTLISKLVAAMSARGWRVGCIKHDGHDFSYQEPDVDTRKFLDSGATVSMVVSSTGHVLSEWRRQEQVTLNEWVARLGNVDLVIVEGYKALPVPKWILLEDNQGDLPYTLPNFAKNQDILGHIKGIIVPAPPLKVADTSLPVYHRDNILGILSAIEVMMG